MSNESRLFVDKAIWVSGIDGYQERNWREAILAFLFGLWSSRYYIANTPTISFGNLTLRLDRAQKRYLAYGRGMVDLNLRSAVAADGEDVLHVNDPQFEVEGGLVRFVKSNRIKTLIIHICHPQGVGMVILWKADKRGQYWCWSSEDLPRRWSDYD